MADEADIEKQEEETSQIGDGTSAIDDSPEAGIESLRQQIVNATKRADDAEKAREEERRGRQAEGQAREEAERRARAASEEAFTTRRSANDAQYDSVINALAAAQGELGGIKSAYKAAMSEGDLDKAADLAAEIGLVAAKVREFESGKTVLEQRRQAGEQPDGPARSGDPREEYIRSRTPRTATWLRRNDRYFSDPSFQRMVHGAHELAVGRGIMLDSDEYFRFIEDQAGVRGNDSGDLQHQQPAPIAPAPAAPPPRQAAPAHPSAPAAGSTQAARTSSPGTIRLTAEEREFCRSNEINEAAYAKRKGQMLADGEIGSTRH